MADVTGKSSGDETYDVVVVSAPESTDGSKEEKPPTSKTEPVGDNVDKVKDGTEEKKDEKSEEKKKVMVGSISERKDLYAKYDKNGHRSWSENPPDGLEEAAENEETKKFAVLVRKSTSIPMHLAEIMLTSSQRNPGRVTPAKT